MIIGHYGVSFALKRQHPGLPLWHYIIAVEWMDVLHSTFVLTGVERAAIVPGITALVPVDLIYYPYTHSLLAACLWSLAAYALYRWTRLGGDDRPRAALLMGIAVFSHFVLDFVTHRADLPLLFESHKVGLGLWNHLYLAFGVECAVLLVPLWWYLRGSTPTDGVGRYGLQVLAALGTLLLVGFPLGVLSNDIAAAEITALASYLVVGVGAFVVDRRRKDAA